MELLLDWYCNLSFLCLIHCHKLDLYKLNLVNSQLYSYEISKVVRLHLRRDHLLTSDFLFSPDQKKMYRMLGHRFDFGSVCVALALSFLPMSHVMVYRGDFIKSTCVISMNTMVGLVRRYPAAVGFRCHTWAHLKLHSWPEIRTHARQTNMDIQGFIFSNLS